jgi:hypothetical protein
LEEVTSNQYLKDVPRLVAEEELNKFKEIQLNQITSKLTHPILLISG